MVTARTTQTVLDVFGLKRTGNHAIITWVLANSPRLSAHHNNKPLHFEIGWRDGGCRPPVLSPKKPVDVQFSGISKAEVKRYKDVGTVMVTREDKDFSEGYSTKGLRKFGNIRRRRVVLILRDPFNHFASLYKRYVVDGEGGEGYWSGEIFGEHNELPFRQYPVMWVKYAKEFLDPRYLVNPLRVNYNKWFVDAEYRQALARSLGLTSSNKGLSTISHWGSSFGDTGDARTMAVLDRWKVFRDDPCFRAMFTPEIVELSKRIFGEIQGTDTWVKESV